MRHKALVMVIVTMILATAAWASSESLLYSFNSFTGDGYYPYSGLVADAKGNLYGTTYSGGNGYGTVFELKLSGGTYTEVQLHSFNLGTSDGQYPEYSSLVLDKAGNLYGTTAYGGVQARGIASEVAPLTPYSILNALTADQSIRPISSENIKLTFSLTCRRRH